MKRQAEREHAESPKRKKVKFAVEGEPAARLSTKENTASSTSTKDSKPKLKKKGPTALEKLAAHTGPSSKFGIAPPIRQARSKQEKEEDAYIAYLESKLGWSKGGSKTSKYGKELEEDGIGGEHVFSLRFFRSSDRLSSDLLQDIDNIEATVFSAGPVSQRSILCLHLVQGYSRVAMCTQKAKTKR